MASGDAVVKKTTVASRTTLKIPIALKFAGFITVLIVAFMTWQTLVAIRAAGEHLDKQVNKSGILLTTSLATLINPNWVTDHRHQRELEALLKRFVQSRGIPQVLNVVVHDLERPIATALGEREFKESQGRRVASPEAKAARVEIRAFSYEGMSVRGFSRPLLVKQASEESREVPVGEVEVYVSAREIDESRHRLSSAMIRVSATACLIAALGAFLLARYLTRPIRALVRDMKHVSLGNLRHKSNVRTSDELGGLAQAFNVMTASLLEAQETRLAQRAMEHELSLATEIQKKLLPSGVPDIAGYDVAHHYAPAREVGGDYFDFLKIDAEHLAAVVADVSGKGIPASLIMTMTRSLLRVAAKGDASPVRTVELVNRFLTPDMNPGMFVTLVYVVLNLKTGEGRLVRAGHNPPLFYSSKRTLVIPMQPRGMGVGLDRTGDVFGSDLQVQRFTLQKGDVLVLYTDGVVEGKSREGEEYSTERLSHLLKNSADKSAKQIVDAIVGDLARHERGVEPSDDVTLLVVKKS